MTIDSVERSGSDKSADHTFKVGQKVVYSSHGVGEITAVEQSWYGDHKVECYVVQFSQQNLSIKVPVTRASCSGLRPIITSSELEEVYEVLKSESSNTYYKNKVKKFSDYKQKLNSGNIIELAKLVRTLYKPDCQQASYSQKSIYGSAINILANELALLKEREVSDMIVELEEILAERTHYS